jgi:hypothetical protein
MEESKRIFLFTRFTGQMLLLLCLLAGTVEVGQAQSTATLQGTVSDPNGNPIAGARVVARNQETGVASETAADNAGQYLFATVPIGVYRVKYFQPGFETLAFTDLRTGRRDDRQGAGRLPLVDVTTSNMGQVINEKTVQDIPLNGRHFTDLSLLTPGTVTPPANGFLSFPLRGQGSFGINTAGSREDTTNWLVNGRTESI